MRAAIGLAAFVALLAPAATVSAAGEAAPDRSIGAAAAPPSCPAGFLCGYTERDFEGRVVLIAPEELRDCWGLTQDEIFRSVWNATSLGVTAWISQFCWGATWWFAPNAGGNPPFQVSSLVGR